jgi:3D (Asp-Asp-Asp) domain-containing protein
MQSRVARRWLALGVGALLVLAVFTTRTRDSTEEVFDASGRPRLGTDIGFDATAYCKGDTTAAGVQVRSGIAAADPTLLPLGSVVRVESNVPAMNGIWTVLDTGPEIKGRELDLYVWSCTQALAFGRRRVTATILRLGWDPNASVPPPSDRFWRRQDPAPPPVSPPG